MIGDKNKLKLYVERYLELSGELKNKKGQVGAHIQLGRIERESVSLNKIIFNRENIVRVLSILRKLDILQGKQETKTQFMKPLFIVEFQAQK